MNKHLALGSEGESAICKYLEQQGFKILVRNYRLRWCGEIDVIAQQNEVICFVEIKTRSSEYFPTSQVITRTKQLKIIKTAQRYASEKKVSNKVLRFDVAIVTGTHDSFKISYIPNAFTHSSRYLY